MSPWGNGEERIRNWRFVIIMIYLFVVTITCAYALKQVSDYSLRNRELLHQIAHLSQESDYKLCLSVNKGKVDRIDEYQFTLKRTREIYAEMNLPTENLKITEDFYNSLIQRARDSIVPCPPVPLQRH